MGMGSKRHALVTFPPENTRCPYEDGWTRGAVWKGKENLARTGIRSPDRTARSKSLSLPSFKALYLAVNSLCTSN
jgi:hypothetical protein